MYLGAGFARHRLVLRIRDIVFFNIVQAVSNVQLGQGTRAHKGRHTTSVLHISDDLRRSETTRTQEVWKQQRCLSREQGMPGSETQNSILPIPAFAWRSPIRRRLYRGGLEVALANSCQRFVVCGQNRRIPGLGRGLCQSASKKCTPNDTRQSATLRPLI